MSHEAAYHDGYQRALEDIDRLVAEMMGAREGEWDRLRDVLHTRIEKARCLTNSCLAADASGSRGY